MKIVRAEAVYNFRQTNMLYDHTSVLFIFKLQFRYELAIVNMQIPSLKYLTYSFVQYLPELVIKSAQSNMSRPVNRYLCRTVNLSHYLIFWGLYNNHLETTQHVFYDWSRIKQEGSRVFAGFRIVSSMET